ncbi:putative 2-hydroxypenta-2,4-dienoate hydratase [Gordonia hirsuta DSM 44140 = NBRC 16056]|uniref:Putative 2-hydroxypenta-2,4-dienoate hydratase n=1 Tax=Gordonia hirsuta DSM 44140 = NBRC 16056 TaxID=1121927 RepID=L7L7H9_9ACTN|nr:fumarylacetoacetate hydrolase family protein [Gordonia hirsuta]GAC55958.1 putative 2-hydroxypenta-2,4-dienoate hydratase [Gordonia hirsuta DSM 44140 = NBRC 16056]
MITDLDSDIAEAQAAARLLTALQTRTACTPVRDLIGPTDLAAAYRVQERISGGRIAAGATVVGRKIGLTSKAVQEQMGVDQPDFGVLFDDMAYAHERTVPIERLLQPKAEAEVAFVLKADLIDGPLDLEQIRAAVGYGVAALEVCDSRIDGWDIAFADTVADNASSGVYVLGTEHKTLEEFSPVEVGMSMTINGEQVSTGTGAACLGDPLNAVAWLARAARDFGDPLRAGQLVLSGALGPMAPIAAGDEVTVQISGLGTVRARFE